MGFKIVWPMLPLRASIQDKKYAHVMSFRRQIFVNQDDNIMIPESIMASDGVEQTNYRVYIIDDSIISENCKQHGLNKLQCKTNTTNTESTPTLKLSAQESTELKSSQNMQANTQSLNTKNQTQKIQPSQKLNLNKYSTNDTIETITNLNQLTSQ